MGSAAILAVTLVPVLMGYFIRGRIPREESNPLNRLLIAIYRPILRMVLRFPKTLLVVSVLFALSAVLPLAGVGGYLAPLKWVGSNSWQLRVSHWQNDWAQGWANTFSFAPKIAELGQGLGSEFMPTLDEGDLLTCQRPRQGYRLVMRACSCKTSMC